MDRIVIIDDEPLILKALTRLLTRAPCLHDGHLYRLEIVAFSDPVKALNYIEEHSVSIILSDYRMPVMDGVSLLTECKRKQPQAIRMIISGYADLNGLVEAINRANIFRFISKPWNDYELIASIGMALRQRQLEIENQLLADQARLHQGDITEEEIALKNLESLSPGITSVRWGPDGSVIIEDDEV